MKHRRRGPVDIGGIESESLEQVTASVEIGVQSGEQQTLPEPTRAAQEIILTLIHQFRDKTCLVDVGVASLDNLGEGLYAYGVFLCCHNFSIFCKDNKYFRYRSVFSFRERLLFII